MAGVTGLAAGREMIVIDEVADRAALAAAVRPGIEVVLVTAGRDALEQIGAALRTRGDVASLHIVSHGRPGAVLLGGAPLDAAELVRRADEVRGWRRALARDAEILLYGCDVAAGAAGEHFLAGFAALTGARVAASTDPTGAAAAGGDWELEARAGNVRAALPFVSGFHYAGVLPAPRSVNSGFPIHVRPGGTSYTWTIANGLNAGNNQYYPITDFAFQHIPAFNWNLTRGRIEYSTDGGSTWSTYTLTTSPAPVNFVPVSGKLWRFVDTSPANTASSNSFGTAWRMSDVPGSSTTGGNVIPDNAPTDITSNRATVFSTATAGSTVATLTPTDTGSTLDGYWSIDSQSVANLFTVAFNRATGNTATLKLGSGTLPPLGQTATVTVRYRDLYQTDDLGEPIPGQGIAKTLTFTVVPESSNDLTLGDDIAINTHTTGDQRAPAIAALSDGRLVIVWQSSQQGGAAFAGGIYGQLLSAAGAKLGGEFVISNAAGSVDEVAPAVTALNDGRYAVAYARSGATYDIALRIVEADGTVGAQLVANSTTAGEQYECGIATLTDGSFVVVWSSSNGDVRLRRFNASNGSPVAAEVVIVSGAVNSSGSTTAGGYFPSVAALAGGSYAVTWVDYATGEVQAKVAGGGTIATGLTSMGYGPPRIAGLAGGGFVVVTEAYDSGSDLTDIRAARYDQSGALQGGVFRVNAGTTGNRYQAALAALSGGGFVAGWVSERDDYDLGGIFGRRFNAAGTAVDPTDFEINQHRLDDQSQPVLAPLADDRFAAAWTDIDASSIADSSYLGDIEARLLLPAGDTTPPAILSITRLSPVAQTIGDASVTFRVTYSEAVQGVSASSFAVEPVNGSTIVGVVSGVSGTGATRDVTVNITRGSGEFRLKVID